VKERTVGRRISRPVWHHGSALARHSPTCERPAFSAGKRTFAIGRKFSKLAESAAELARTLVALLQMFSKDLGIFVLDTWRRDSPQIEFHRTKTAAKRVSRFCHMPGKSLVATGARAGAGVRGILGERSSVNDQQTAARLWTAQRMQ
jgi:hypothetical protein